MPLIPIMRPKQPSAERLMPYLKAIDSTRIYSNFGPLVRAFEERLSAHFGVPDGTVTTVANCTLGLALALAAQGAQPGTLCLMPAWTFVACAQAATMAGLVPYFVDVGPDTWALDPESVVAAIGKAPSRVGAVMPVAPFGQPINVIAWEHFRSRARLPVVIDAAAAFDSIVPSSVSAVVSLHATKAFCIGEGGFVMSTDTSFINEVRSRSNFGFMGSREAAVPAINAKLSEYHAAVGLAGLEEWVDTRSEWLAVAELYRKALPGPNSVRFQEGFGESWIASTCVLSFGNSEADRVERELSRAGIQTRRWWGQGAHAHPATSSFPRTLLPTTEALAHSVAAVPFYRDVRVEDVHRVCEAVTKASIL